jgi:hypothetical protein
MEMLPSLMSEQDLQDLSNADECGLCCNVLPDKKHTLVGAREVSKGKITVRLCVNTDESEKMPLLANGNYVKMLQK